MRDRRHCLMSLPGLGVGLQEDPRAALHSEDPEPVEPALHLLLPGTLEPIASMITGVL